MAEEVFEIRLDYTADTSKASRGLDGLGMKMLSLNQAVELFQKAWSMADRFLSPLVKLNAGIETSTISMASLLNATKGWEGGFKGAMAASSDLIKKFEADAAASLGTTDDFIQTFLAIQPVLSGLAMPMEDMRRLTGELVVGAGSLGVNLGVAANQMSMILSGSAGRQLDTFRKLFAEELATKGTKFVEAFNSMKAADRLAAVQAKLASFKVAAEAIENSFEGMASTLEDKVTISLREMGQGLFEAVKDDLRDLLKWIDKNQDAIKEFGQQVGKALVEGFKALKEIGAWLIDNRELVMGLVGGLGALKLGGGVAGALKGVGAISGGLPVNILAMAPAAAAVIAGLLENEGRKVEERGEMLGGITAALDSRFSGFSVGGHRVRAGLEGTMGTLGKAGIGRDDIAMFGRAGMRSTFKAALSDDLFEFGPALGELPPKMRALAEAMRKAGATGADVNIMFSRMNRLAGELAEADLLKPFESALTGIAMLPVEIVKGVMSRASKKTPSVAINKVVIRNDFKSSANPERVKAAVIGSLERVTRNRVHARTAPGVG